MKTERPKYDACPLCGKGPAATEAVIACPHCEALYGCTRKAYGEYLVNPFEFTKNDPGPEGQRYFDFYVQTMEGWQRRHGWFNPADKKLTQVG